MIALRDALRLLCDEARPLGTIEVELERAQGRVLGEEVHADRDAPPTDRSAMDGFAVRSADVERAGRLLEIVGEVRAGHAVGGLQVGPGQAARIMTGAIVPPGADAVVMVERTEERPDDGRVAIDDRPEVGQHIRRRGEELAAGKQVLGRGSPIHAPELAALSSVGRTRVRVFRPPVVHVLSTGDEVVEPDAIPLPHQVRNSNARTLLAQLRELELEGSYLGIARDDPGSLERLLERGFSGDMLLITGGVSAGDYDLVGEALEAAGMRLLFHRVAVKPGKPVLAGLCGSCLVVGLPGNPISAYTGFAILVAPALRKMSGAVRWRNLPLQAVLREPLRARPDRETYHLARLGFADGRLSASRVRSAGSGDVLSLARANGFVVTPVGCDGRQAGAELPALLWRDFQLRGAVFDGTNDDSAV